MDWGLPLDRAFGTVWRKVTWSGWFSHTTAGCQPAVHGGHWDQACLSVTISPSASAPLPLFLWNSLINFPAQPAIAQLISSTFSFLYCSIPKHNGFAQNEPIAYQFWALHVYIFSRQILVQVFILLLSRAKDHGPSCDPKNPWLCLDHTPQLHPVSGLKPGAECAPSTMYTGRRN